jgi:hypothetical protein
VNDSMKNSADRFSYDCLLIHALSIVEKPFQ